MKLGMPTLVECKDIFECCDVASQHGLDFVEINMSFPQYLPSALSVDSILERARRDGLFFTIHADEMLNPFDFNPKVSACYFDVMRETVRFAKAIGAPVVNMHLLKGVYVTLPGEVILLSDVYRTEYMARVKEFIAMCEAEIGNSNLKIAIENVDTNAFTESQIAALELFLASPVFALTLDTGHELCLGFADTPIFKRYRDKLVHLHLHDAKGTAAHLPLGTAEVAIASKLSLLPPDKTCLIEVKTLRGLAESIVYLKKNRYIEP